MKDGLLSLLEKCRRDKNRAALAAAVGVLAMLLILDTQSGDLQSQNTHVLLDDGSALTETVCQPQIRGVAVLCDGGGDVRVASRITELLTSLLDLPSNRICVEQRKP